jgi:hypothetical protein
MQEMRLAADPVNDPLLLETLGHDEAGSDALMNRFS